jgi:hypothetical protein
MCMCGIAGVHIIVSSVLCHQLHRTSPTRYKKSLDIYLISFLFQEMQCLGRDVVRLVQYAVFHDGEIGFIVVTTISLSRIQGLGECQSQADTCVRHYCYDQSATAPASASVEPHPKGRSG